MISYIKKYLNSKKHKYFHNDRLQIEIFLIKINRKFELNCFNVKKKLN